MTHSPSSAQSANGAIGEREMSLRVALDFADNPRPYPSLAAPADTNGELYRALKVIASAYRAALTAEKVAAEPVAWRAPNLSGSGDIWAYRDADDRFEGVNGEPTGEALYTSPQPAQTQVALTDEQMMTAIKSVCGFDADKAEQWRPEALAIGRAVERALLREAGSN